MKDLITWREDVVKQLKYMVTYTHKLKGDAVTLTQQLRHALTTVARATTVHTMILVEGYEALRFTVGGALPKWDANDEMRNRKHNKALIAMTIRLQKLFIERLNEWTTYAAPSGGYRQRKWDHREWSKLI